MLEAGCSGIGGRGRLASRKSFLDKVFVYTQKRHLVFNPSCCATQFYALTSTGSLAAPGEGIASYTGGMEHCDTIKQSLRVYD